MVVCEECGKEVRDRRALAGHKRFKHTEEYRRQEAISQTGSSVPETDLAAMWDQMSPEELKAQIQSLAGQVIEGLKPAILEQISLESGKTPPFDSEQFVDSIVTKLRQMHPAGLCSEEECPICPGQKMALTNLTMDKIEERVPGTIQAVAEWERKHEPIALK